jgi:Tfp pilus assembly protein PilP
MIGLTLALIPSLFLSAPALAQPRPPVIPPNGPRAAAPAQPQAPQATGASQAAGGQAPEQSDKPNYAQMRDPFKQPAFPARKVEIRTELERFKLDEFRYIGVLTGPKRMRAMLKAGNDQTFLVSENMKIGQRDGKILKITPDSILVREKVVNVMGEEENLDTEIPLQSGPGK